MKLWSLIILFSTYVTLNANEASEKFSRIKVLVPDRSTLDLIWSAGVDYEGATGRVGGWMEFVVGRSEIEQLKVKGVQYTIVVQDIAKDYTERFIPETPSAQVFGKGSMGGHYTYDEVCQQLDSMKYTYPDLITEKDSIGCTIGGRTIWAVKISDNPTYDDPQKPEVLLTALHHAREPMGMMSILYLYVVAA